MSATTPPTIHVGDLEKVFRVPVREAGLRAAFKSLARREHKDIRAVNRVSFEIGQGEIVGFLGPNGAGKTTTLKMLSGLLHPTGGDVRVLGLRAVEARESAYLRRMTMVMGNRNQLQWDLPALDSYELNRAIYRLDPERVPADARRVHRAARAGELVRKPVRNLSLGERMKVEICGALLHRPRRAVPRRADDRPRRDHAEAHPHVRRRLQRALGATVLLTSHYMADVEALCKRVIVIHHGRHPVRRRPVGTDSPHSTRPRRSASSWPTGPPTSRAMAKWSAPTPAR